MFGFDERYAMFDITPVENQFILEYLPEAKGDYVKVYLYGLMRCYHPEEDMTTIRRNGSISISNRKTWFQTMTAILNTKISATLSMKPLIKSGACTEVS